MNFFLILMGKVVVYISRFVNLGSGSTWPGHIALSLNPNFIKQIVEKNKFKIILIAGTNGKTTTAKLLGTILTANDKTVFQNEGGANLLNGIASSLIFNSRLTGKLNKDFAIFEIDENTLPLILQEINNPEFVLILNLFRDQLDRYGEINTISQKWREALKKLSSKTKLILNADDPQAASLGFYRIVKAISIPYRKRSYASVSYFGLNDRKFAASNYQHASDSAYCTNCNSKLLYSFVFYSHLGNWKCPKCKNARPKLNISNSPIYPLSGIYNRYNTIAAVSLARLLNIPETIINSSLKKFKPAFGRQEILSINEKKVQIFLSKNPTSFNESLRTIRGLNAKNVLAVLNDRIPDGRDVSWIWDVDFDEVKDLRGSISVAGDRMYDMALRLKYENIPIEDEQIYTDLESAIFSALQRTAKSETLYILPTYSAMLEVRKILTGKKIL